MVEVKGTRTARASLNAPTLRTRPDTNLWHELAELDAKPPQPDIQAPAPSRPERKEAEAPVRRVLPSLVPMFEIAAEAEPEAAAPPMRRSRTRSERAPVDVQVAAPAPKPAAKPRSVVARPKPADHLPVPAPAPVQVTAPAPVAGPAEAPSQRPTGWRRTKELRLGERWKRRLPHFAR